MHDPVISPFLSVTFWGIKIFTRKSFTCHSCISNGKMFFDKYGKAGKFPKDEYPARTYTLNMYKAYPVFYLSLIGTAIIFQKTSLTIQFRNERKPHNGIYR